MARIMGIDYGKKRTGIAVTDPLQIIASALETVSTPDLFSFLNQYLATEEVEIIVVGEPLNLDGSPTDATPLVYQFVKKLKTKFPSIPIELTDERYTSKRAKEFILKSGVNKKKRRDKSLVDKISAALILEDYMKTKQGW